MLVNYFAPSAFSHLGIVLLPAGKGTLTVEHKLSLQAHRCGRGSARSWLGVERLLGSARGREEKEGGLAEGEAKLWCRPHKQLQLTLWGVLELRWPCRVVSHCAEMMEPLYTSQSLAVGAPGRCVPGQGGTLSRSQPLSWNARSIPTFCPITILEKRAVCLPLTVFLTSSALVLSENHTAR